MKPKQASAGRHRAPASVRMALLGCALVVGGALYVPAQADEGDGRSTAEDVGHATGSTVRDIGTGAREAGREIGEGAAETGREIGQAGRSVGHTVRDAAVVTWYHVKEGGKAVGRTVRDGSRAFVRGLKGEPER